MDKNKKQILFIHSILDSGGVSKSLLSILTVIDKEKYNVSLLLLSTKGVFSNNIPKDISLITDRRITSLTAGLSGLKDLFIHGNFLLFFGSILRMFISLFNKGQAGLLLSKLFPRVSQKKYDLAVDYCGQHLLYYMCEKVNAEKKISFFHSDYRCWNYYESIDRKYYARVDGIFTISEVCVSALKEVFPEYASKIQLMENIVSPATLENLSLEPIKESKQKKYLLVSIGHVCKAKGSVLAIHTAAELKIRGIVFEWWFIGNKSTDANYTKLVAENNLNENIFFLGFKSNPYPYIRYADIVVHLSQFEGKSIALDEAKILCKPIVVTNFSTVKDQFINGINGSICQMNVQSAADAIEALLKNKTLQDRYKLYLKEHIVDNSSEIKKIYSFL